MTYDFKFVELAINFLESGDTEILREISELAATDTIYNHARFYNYDVPTNSKLELVTYLLTPSDKYKEVLPQVVDNLIYAKENVTKHSLVEKVVMQYFPKEFLPSGSIYFTFGYDIGICFNINCTLNLAHPFMLDSIGNIKYYAIHEMHHAGFTELRGGCMPSLAISTYKEMTHLVENLTHLEAMGTYAPLRLREKENAMNSDIDYIVLQDKALVDDFTKKYFDIYNYFKDHPDYTLTDEDWSKLNILSGGGGERLWYVVGAQMARIIDQQLGRDALTSLISQPSENFIATYMELENR